MVLAAIVAGTCVLQYLIPAVCIASLSARTPTWPNPSPLEGREVSYLVVALFGAYYTPHFLLTNIAAGWWGGVYRDMDFPLKERIWNLTIFAFTPEKFIIWVMSETFDRESEGEWQRCRVPYWPTYLPHPTIHRLVVVPLFLCDFCAIAALTVGAARGILPIPLGISYAFTALSGLVIFGWVVVDSLSKGEYGTMRSTSLIFIMMMVLFIVLPLFLAHTEVGREAGL